MSTLNIDWKPVKKDYLTGRYTLEQLAQGDLSMLLTIAAMLFGAAIAANMAGLSNSAIQQPLANLDEPSIAAACFLVPASAWAARDVWRLWRAWPQGASLSQVLLASPYRLSAAAAVLGISNGVLYALHGSGPIRPRSSAR